MAQICGDPTYLMGANAGDVNSGTALATTVDKLCLKSLIAVKVLLVTSQRECWFCPVEAGTAMSWVIKSFTVPVTMTRKLTGFSMIVTASSGTFLYASPGEGGTAVSSTTLSKVGTIT